MGRFAKATSFVYVMASLFVLGSFVAVLLSPDRARIAALVASPAFRAGLVLCFAIMLAQLLYVIGRIIFVKPEPAALKIPGVPDAECTLEAIESVARISAQAPDALIEDVSCRLRPKAPEPVSVEIQCIYLEDAGADAMARGLKDRVAGAIDAMLGVKVSSVKVRILPSKTKTVTKEVTNER